MNTNPRKNAEGYPDPTAYKGTRNIIREETELENRVNALIKARYPTLTRTSGGRKKKQRGKISSIKASSHWQTLSAARIRQIERWGKWRYGTNATLAVLSMSVLQNGVRGAGSVSVIKRKDLRKRVR